MAVAEILAASILRSNRVYSDATGLFHPHGAVSTVCGHLSCSGISKWGGKGWHSVESEPARPTGSEYRLRGLDRNYRILLSISGPGTAGEPPWNSFRTGRSVGARPPAQSGPR